MRPYQVLSAVAAHYELPINVLVGRSRVADVAEARSFVMFICVKRLGLSGRAVGRVVCRTRSNVSKMVDRVEWRVRNCRHTAQRYADTVESLKFAEHYFKVKEQEGRS